MIFLNSSITIFLIYQSGLLMLSSGDMQCKTDFSTIRYRLHPALENKSIYK
jgi:hypothetical protein